MDDEHLQSSAGYLTGTVWEKISVDFSTHRTPYVLTVRILLNKEPDPDTLLS